MTSKRIARVTLAHVAAAAGVSESTASRAFTRPELIKAENVERIRRIGAELGYTVDHHARALSTGRTSNIAVIVPDIANPYFPPLVRAVESGADAAGFAVFLGDSDETAQRESTLVDRLEQQVDGFILASPRMPDAEIIDLAGRVPTVVINRDVPGVPRVLVDAANGVRQAVELLVAMGHRFIAYLAGPPETWADSERRGAVIAAARTAGIEVAVLELGRPSYEVGRESVGSLIATGATAAIAFDDVIAHGVLAGFSLLGMEVPADFSVVGCDDVLAATTLPALTTVSSGSAVSGATALAALLPLLEGREGEERRVIEGHLVHRSSVAPPRKSATP